VNSKASRLVFLLAPLLLAPGSVCAAPFIRGDTDASGRLGITDAIRIFGYLFLGTPARLECLDAADADDNGAVQITDGIAILNLLFLGGPPLPPPRSCGEDPTPDALGCEAFPLCDGPGSFAVSITSPASLSFFASSPIEVRGTVSAGPAAEVAVNGKAAALQGAGWSVQVPLLEGNNTLTAVARSPAGEVSTASILVTLDTTPPRLAIRSPPDGFVTGAPSITVSGMVNDIVSGTVNEGEARVTVNGIAAQVSNRSFLAAGVPLAAAANPITAIGLDRVGNEGRHTVTVRREVPSGKRLELVSGDGQAGMIGSELAAPLAVRLLLADGRPAAAETVIFKVTGNNGLLTGGGRTAATVAVTSDAAGRAEARWRLGSRAGAGSNLVAAYAVGFAGRALFNAVSRPGAAAKINVDAGDLQAGMVGRPLPHPFVAVVTDLGHNRLAGVQVVFRVLAGGGNLGGSQQLTRLTDQDGRAAAIITLGPAEGLDNNAVEATFAGNPGAAAVFTASAFVPGPPEETTLSGIILDNTDTPVPGVTVNIEGTQTAVWSDQQGQFRIRPAPVGQVRFRVDGITAERPGVWPHLAFDLVTVPGRDNTLGMPIYLLPIDVERGLPVDEARGGILTLAQVPGFSLEVKPGSATFPDGSRSGVVSVTLVHADKVPMPPNFGQQPRFIVTIQPAGVVFEPPAPITYPNLEGLSPREITELYSFDHDLMTFVSIGTGSVSDDGTLMRSDPGVGIIKGGWHSGGPPLPAGGAENCDVRVTIYCGPKCREVDGPTPLVLVAGEEATLTAQGNPEPGTYSWTSSAPGAVEIVGPSTQPSVRLRRRAPGRATLTVTFTCKSGASDDDSAEVIGARLDLDSDADKSGAIDEEDDPIEAENPGKAVGIDGALVHLLLDFASDEDLTGYLLVLEATRPNIRVWDSPEKLNEIVLPKTFIIGRDAIPSILYVEGLEPGVSFLSVSLRAPSGGELLRDVVLLSVVDVEFVATNGELQDTVTTFSDPFPVVTLEEVRSGDIRLAGNQATITLRGTVVDSIADIVSGGRADISRVFVEYVQGPAAAPSPIAAGGEGGGAGPEPGEIVSLPVDVSREPGGQASPQRPHPFRGAFTATARIPLWKGDVKVWVKAVNAAGNAGYDSFTLHVAGQELESIETPEGTLFFVKSVSLAANAVTNHDSKAPGLLNPIRVRIRDDAVGPAKVQRLKARVNGVEVGLKLSGGELQLETPILGLAGAPPGGIPNLFDGTGAAPVTVVYRGVERRLSWAYTAHSPPAYYKYAAGTTVRHVVRSEVFRRLRIGGITAVRVQRGVPNAGPDGRYGTADDFEEWATTPRSGASTSGRCRGGTAWSPATRYGSGSRRRPTSCRASASSPPSPGREVPMKRMKSTSATSRSSAGSRR
jgi:hypothetical protein